MATSTTTRPPQFSGAGMISPGSSAEMPTGTLYSDEVRSGVVHGASEPTERVSAAMVGDRLHEDIGKAADAVRAGAEHVQQRSQRWLDASRSGVRHRPLTWVGVAVAAGALIGRLVR